MGSDTAPQVLFEAVIRAKDQLDAAVTFLVFATQEVLDTLSITYPAVFNHKSRIHSVTVKEVIDMEDDPLYAIRHKKNSSIVTGIRSLRKHKIDAFVSAGNTGALIASTTLSLQKLPGINRPALLALLPTKLGMVAVVDVGGNVSCKAQHLIQFAHMGAAYQRCHMNIESPTVGLLNIGSESKKGTTEIRQAYQMLKDLSAQVVAQGLKPRMNFIGNIEGRDVFEGKVDVLVTSGFAGNVLLKSTEGVAKFIFDSLLANIDLSDPGPVQEAVGDLKSYFNYAEYPGAIVCGVDGIVVKCHGSASAKAMFNSIKGAVNLVEKRLIEKIKEHLN
jgi:glycerol-3-phosphate acyltransferase PlsX